LEFETPLDLGVAFAKFVLKFTPLEFETKVLKMYDFIDLVLKFTPLEFETLWRYFNG